MTQGSGRFLLLRKHVLSISLFVNWKTRPALFSKTVFFFGKSIPTLSSPRVYCPLIIRTVQVFSHIFLHHEMGIAAAIPILWWRKMTRWRFMKYLINCVNILIIYHELFNDFYSKCAMWRRILKKTRFVTCALIMVMFRKYSVLRVASAR